MRRTSNDLPEPAHFGSKPSDAGQHILHFLRGDDVPSYIYKRVIGLFVFVALVVLFRHLALVGVTFVVFTHALGYLGQRAGRLLHGNERGGTRLVLVCVLIVFALAAWLLVRVGGQQVKFLLAQYRQDGQSLTQLFQQLHEDLLHRLPAWLPVEGFKERVPHMVQPAVDYLRATGRTLLHVLIGFIMAVIYVLDRKPVDTLLCELPENSIFGTVRRYFGYLSEAILITISLQVLVALVNTAVTLPVLLVLRLPHIPAFTALIFFSSLIPVVGNLVSGAALIAASFMYRGLWAVGFFIVSTFILHKIEAYYLNPRLATRHVNLPALVIIVSLILHEHLFGFVGLFLSFPVLYVGMNIARDLRGAADKPAAPPALPPRSFTEGES